MRSSKQRAFDLIQETQNIKPRKMPLAKTQEFYNDFIDALRIAERLYDMGQYEALAVTLAEPRKKHARKFTLS